MAKLALRYPGYGWEQNAGYPTRDHRDASAFDLDKDVVVDGVSYGSFIVPGLGDFGDRLFGTGS